MGVLNGTEAGLKDINIIGGEETLTKIMIIMIFWAYAWSVSADISMQDVMVVYDNEKEQIGWGRANCDRFPRTGTHSLEESLPNLGSDFRVAAETEEEEVAQGVNAPSPLPVTPDAV